jgi:hypothetical protein
MQDTRYRMQDRCRVPGIGYRLSGTWDLVPGTGAGPTPKAGHRAPKTEPGHWKTRTPGLHPASILAVGFDDGPSYIALLGRWRSS